MAAKRTAKPPKLTRQDVAIELRCALGTVISLQRKGVLTGKQDTKGRWWYEASDVARAKVYQWSKSRKRAGGELEARAFEMFRAGLPMVEIVIALRVTSRMLREMRREFDADCWCLSAKQSTTLQSVLESRGVKVSSPAELVRGVQVLAQREKQRQQALLSKQSQR